MKAGILRGIEDLVVAEIPDLVREEGSVILRVDICSVCASDLRTYHFGHHRAPFPHVLGHEIVGEIQDGGQACGFKQGDRVVVFPKVSCGDCYYCKKGQYNYCLNGRVVGFELQGGFATHLELPLNSSQHSVLKKIPENVSSKVASLTEPLSCCIRAQKASGVGRNDVVTVIGGGPLGIMHCRLARLNKAGKVILVARNIDRLRNIALDCADEVVDPRSSDPVEAISGLTDGRGADVVIVSCSSHEAQSQSLQLVAKGGRVNLFGGLPSDQSDQTISGNVVHYREIGIQGSHGSTPQDFKEALDMLGNGQLAVGDLLSCTFPLEEIREAFQLADSRSAMHVGICP